MKRNIKWMITVLCVALAVGVGLYFLLRPEETHQLSEEMGVRIPSFGHAGDGNLHVYICRDELSDSDWKDTLKQCFDKMYEKEMLQL